MARPLIAALFQPETPYPSNSDHVLYRTVDDSHFIATRDAKSNFEYEWAVT